MSDRREAVAATLLSRDLATGLLFAAVGLGFAFGGAEYGIGDTRRMGPGYFPVLIGAALALVGAGLVLRAIVAGIAVGSRTALEAVPRLYLRPLVALTTSVAAFAFSINRFGLIVACLACVLIAGCASATTRWGETIAVAVIMSAVASLVFVQFLGLPMRLWAR